MVSNEARGFIVGAALAYELGVGFIPIRKKGKLPYTCIDLTYKKEYECDSIEIHEDAIEQNQNVLLIDDLLATGGTIKANIQLVEKLGGKIAGIGFLIELDYLNGRQVIGENYDIYSLTHYENTKPYRWNFLIMSLKDLFVCINSAVSRGDWFNLKEKADGYTTG